jgi:hypothetical protein
VFKVMYLYKHIKPHESLATSHHASMPAHIVSEQHQSPQPYVDETNRQQYGTHDCVRSRRRQHHQNQRRHIHSCAIEANKYRSAGMLPSSDGILPDSWLPLKTIDL